MVKSKGVKIFEDLGRDLKAMEKGFKADHRRRAKEERAERWARFWQETLPQAAILALVTGACLLAEFSAEAWVLVHALR